MRQALAPLTHRNRWGYADATAVDLRRPPLDPVPVEVPAQPATLVADLSRSALVVVDMQNDFCAEQGWLASIGVDVSVLGGAITALAELVPAARAAGVPVVWLNWGNRPDQANLPPGVAHVYDPRGVGEGIASTMPDGSQVLTKDSWGAAIVDGLSTEPGDVHVAKYRMSGFWDTELDSVLRNLRVDTLFFGGVNSDQCVFATLIDAACLGYDVVLVDGASATTSPAFCHDATVYNTRQCFGFTVEAGDLAAALQKEAR